MPNFYNNCYHKMYEQFQKNLQRLKNRPKRYLVDVELKQKQYELEVYLDTTLQKIMKRYKDNGFFDDNQQVYMVQVNQQEKPKETKIQDLISQSQIKQKNNNLKIKLISRNVRQNVMQYENSKTQQIQLDKSKLIKQRQSNINTEQVKISIKQLQELLEKIKNKVEIKQIQQKNRKHYKLLKKTIEQMNNTITQKKKTITYYKGFLEILTNRLKSYKQQKNFKNQRQIPKSFIIDQKQKKTIRLDQNEKNIIFMMDEIIKLSRNKSADIQKLEKSYNQQLLTLLGQVKLNLGNQKQCKLQKLNQLCNKNQYQSIKNNIKQITQQIINITQIFNSNKRNFQQKSTSKQKQIKKLNQQLVMTNAKIQELQASLEDFKKMNQLSNKKGIALKTSFINNSEYQNQILYLTQSIEKYENYPADYLETLVQFKRCNNINFDIVTNLLDQMPFSQSTRVLMVIGVQNQNIIIYSTRGVVKQNGSQQSINIKTEKTLPQKTCSSGPGFLILGNQCKMYEGINKNQINSLIKYNKKILTIGNRFNVLYSTKKKIQIQYKFSAQGSQIKDDKDQLQTILKNKKQEVLRIQIYKVNINFRQQQQTQKIQKFSSAKNVYDTSFGGSTEATQSCYQKIQEFSYK